MAIASDARMLLAIAAMFAGVLAHEHITMLTDPMAFVLGNVVTSVHGGRFGRSPSEVISSDLNVVVCEFTQLIVIHPKQLGFLGSAEVKTRDEVDGVGEDGGHDEGVGSAGDNVGDLDVELLVIVIDPATGNDAGVDPVETDDVGCAEQGVGEEAEHPGHTVLSEDIHRVVNSYPVLDY